MPSPLAPASRAVLLGVLVACSGDPERPLDHGRERERDATQRAAPAGAPWFREEARAAGVDFRHESGAGEDGRLFPEIMGGGVALVDVEADGDLDLYFVQSGSLTAPASSPPNRLFVNDGAARFADATAESGADDRGYGMGVATGDVDDDGLTDLYVTNVGPNVLLRNLGGRFADVTAAAGTGEPAWSTSASMFDFDADGDLDLYVCNYVDWGADRELVCYAASGRPDYCSPKSYDAPLSDVLYRNEGDGTFTDVSESAGIRTRRGNGLGVVCVDLIGDERPDVFVANDQMENQLWRNDGGGVFTDVAVPAGCAVDQHGEPKAGMGTLAEDVDDDGDLDILVVNLRAQADSFFRNEGAYFTDDTARAGLGSASRPFTRFGVGWVDFDNDGYLDLYQADGRVATISERDPRSDDPYAEPNQLFAGGPGGTHRRVEPEGGVAEPLVHTSRGAAFGDLDGDGGMDVVVVNRDAPAYVLRNVVAERGNWIRFRVLDESGRDALGARLSIDVGERTLRRDVKTGYSYCAANDPGVHVGLGDESRVRSVRVVWPTGAQRTFGPFEANRVVELTPEPSAQRER